MGQSNDKTNAVSNTPLDVDTRTLPPSDSENYYDASSSIVVPFDANQFQTLQDLISHIQRSNEDEEYIRGILQQVREQKPELLSHISHWGEILTGCHEYALLIREALLLSNPPSMIKSVEDITLLRRFFLSSADYLFIINNVLHLIPTLTDLYRVIATFPEDRQDPIKLEFQRDTIERKLQQGNFSPEMRIILNLIWSETMRASNSLPNLNNDRSKALLNLAMKEEALLTCDETSILMIRCINTGNDNERTKLIKNFLANRDRRVTRSPIGYTAQPNSPTNELCRKIADAINDHYIETTENGVTRKVKSNRRMYELLMPSLKITGVYTTSDDDNSKDDLPPYHEVILSDDLLFGKEVNGTVAGKLIHVKPLLAENDPLILLHVLFHCDLQKLETISILMQSKKTQRAIQKMIEFVKSTLESGEALRVIAYYSKGPAWSYIQSLKKLDEEALLDDVTIETKLKKLTADLRAGGDTKHKTRMGNKELARFEERVGDEKMAGLPATLGIDAFHIWWNALDPEIKKELETHLPSLASARNSMNPKFIGNCVEATSTGLETQLSKLANLNITTSSIGTINISTYRPFRRDNTAAASKKITGQHQAMAEDANSQGSDPIGTYPNSLLIIIAQRIYETNKKEQEFFNFFSLLENNMRGVVLTAILKRNPPSATIYEWMDDLIEYVKLEIKRHNDSSSTRVEISLANFYVVILNFIRGLSLPINSQLTQHLKNYVFTQHPTAFTFINMKEFLELMNDDLIPASHATKYTFSRYFIHRIPILFQTMADCQHIQYFTQTLAQVYNVFFHLKSKRIITSLHDLVMIVDHITYSAEDQKGTIDERKASAYLYFIDIKDTLITIAADLSYLTKFIIQPTDQMAEKFGKTTLGLILTEDNPEPVVKLFAANMHLLPTIENFNQATQGYPVKWKRAAFNYWLENNPIPVLFTWQRFQDLVSLWPEIQAVYTAKLLEKADIMFSSVGNLQQLSTFATILTSANIATIFTKIKSKTPAIISTYTDLTTATRGYPQEWQHAARGVFVELVADDIISRVTTHNIDRATVRTELSQLSRFQSLTPAQVTAIFTKVITIEPPIIDTFDDLQAATANYRPDLQQAAYSLFMESLADKITEPQQCNKLKVLTAEQIQGVFSQIKTKKEWHVTNIQAATREFSAEQKLAAFVGYAEDITKLARWGYQLALIFNSKEDIKCITTSPELTNAMAQLINKTFAKVYEALYILDGNFRLFNPDFLEKIRQANSLLPQYQPQQTLIAVVLTHISVDKDSRSAKLWEIIGQHGNDNQTLFEQVHQIARERQSKGLYYLWGSNPLTATDLTNETRLSPIEQQAKTVIFRR